MLFALIFCQSLNRLQRGLSVIAELLVVISTSVIDCLGRFVPKMTYYVSSGMLNLAQLNARAS